MIEFRMPSIETGMEAGTLVEWYKQPGDKVRRGDIIALVATQKGAMEIEAFDEGVIGEQRVQPGRQVPAGTVLATIFGLEEKEAPRRSPKPNRAKGGQPYNRRGSIRSAFIATARAAQRAVPGISGGHTHADAGAFAVIPSAYRGEAVPKIATCHDWSGLDLQGMRKTIGDAMVRSHREIPHYWVSHAFDVSPLFDWLDEQNAIRPREQRLRYIAPLMKAVAMALRQVPELNGHYVEGVFRPAAAVHMGLATPLRGGGEVAPAIRDADSRNVDELMSAVADLTLRARRGQLLNTQMTDTTITLSNLDEGKADRFLPLIHPPQVAIVGCGVARPRPWVVGKTVAVRWVIEATLAGDHRVNNGRHAARFLARLCELVSQPEAL